MSDATLTSANDPTRLPVPGRKQPMVVGRYPDRGGEMQLFPCSALEFERAVTFFRHRIGSCHFRTGEQVLLLSLFDESVQFTPLQRAINEFGLVRLAADASAFDAPRTESILRRFDIAAVIGLNAAVLDGLQAAGHDIRTLFANRWVWARPDAFDRLRDVPGIRLRRWIEAGPAVAMECAMGDGAHIDRLEWQASVMDDELVLASRLWRSLDFDGYRTGLRVRLLPGGCACGSPDPRIVPLE